MTEVYLSGGECGGALMEVTRAPITNTLLLAAVSANDTSGLVTSVTVDLLDEMPYGVMRCVCSLDDLIYKYRWDTAPQAVYVGMG